MTIRRLYLAAWLLLSFMLSLPSQAAEDAKSLAWQTVAANREGSGTIALSGDIRLTADLPVITGDISIDGKGHTISGDQRYRIFSVHGGALTIKDLTLAQGNASRGEDDMGGALWLEGKAHVVVHNVIFRDNEATRGGAIGIGAGASVLRVYGSSFVNNRAQAGGAIFTDSFRSRVSLANSSLVNNRALAAPSFGGAIYAWNTDTLEIRNSAFAFNAAEYGGAIAARRAYATLTHLSLVDNAGYGSGIYRGLAPSGNYSGAVRLRNSLLASQGDAPDCVGRLTQSIGNFIADGTCSPALTGDPMLDETAGSPPYFHLSAKSPAIEAGYRGYCLAADQLGAARSAAGSCDIGALEYTNE